MRQVFSSPRLENVEGVAQLLRDAGIEVRIVDGRSYKSHLRGNFSYLDNESSRPAVWVVRSEQQLPARELLREAGLMDSTRGQSSYTMPVFRSEARTPAGNAARRRATLMKVGLLAVIAVVMVLGMVLTFNRPPAAQLQTPASPPFDGTAAATLSPVARAVFASELGAVDTPVVCLSVDGRDAPPGLVRALMSKATHALVPASECQRVAEEDRGSFHRDSGAEATLLEISGFRPAAPDAGQVEVSAYHHRMWASYKTLEVRRIEGAWKVVRVIKHVRT
ncbi:MAG: hypothetical protein H0W24_02065 [Lysobacter sp.]|nr:hypothetical protein [Lysobacter sp.]MDQ3270182.1 DUF2007 domain-containing protein [Pseudomonadota bacterium]